MITKPELKVLFPNLEEGLYDAILENAEIKEVPAGTALLKVGQNIRSTMMVIDGTVKLYQEDEEGDEYFFKNFWRHAGAIVGYADNGPAVRSRVGR